MRKTGINTSSTVNWIPFEKNTLPEHGDVVLITLKTEKKYSGNKTTTEYIVCEGCYDRFGGSTLLNREYIPLSNDLPGGFVTFNDWTEGTSFDILAWTSMPDPYCERNV